MPNRSVEAITDPYLLTALVCPLTGGPVILSTDRRELVSLSGKLAFPIRDGIPILVQGEARQLSDAEVRKLSGTRERSSRPDQD